MSVLGKPIKIRGTRIFIAEPDAAVIFDDAQWRDHLSYLEGAANELERGEVLLFDGLALRRSRRGRWVFQVEGKPWREVRTLADIPWRRAQAGAPR